MIRLFMKPHQQSSISAIPPVGTSRWRYCPSNEVREVHWTFRTLIFFPKNRQTNLAFTELIILPQGGHMFVSNISINGAASCKGERF